MSDDQRPGQARRQDDQGMRAFRQGAKEGYLFLDPAGKILSWNAQALTLLGLEAGALAGQAFEHLLPGESWVVQLAQSAARRQPGELMVPRNGGTLLASHTPLEGKGTDPAGGLITLAPLDASRDSQVIARLARQYGDLKQAHDEMKSALGRLTQGDAGGAGRSTRQIAQGLQEIASLLAGADREAGGARVEGLPAPALEAVHQALLKCREALNRLGGLLPVLPANTVPQPAHKFLDAVGLWLQDKLAARAIRLEPRYGRDLPLVAFESASGLEAVGQLAATFAQHALASGSRLTVDAETPAGSPEVVVTWTGSIPQDPPAFLLEGLPTLGLFAAAHILQAHRASVRLERTGDFTSLVMRLPIHAAPLAEPLAATPATLLILEPHPETAAPVIQFFTQNGFQVATAVDAKQALRHLEEDGADLLLLSESLLEQEGLDLLADLKNADAALPIGLLGGHEATAIGQRALDAGVFQRVLRPYRKEDLLALVQKGLEARRVKQEMDLLRQQAAPASGSTEGGLILGESPEMKKIVELIHQVAPTDMTVIVQGESGSGKEVVAHLIHRHSRRVTKPFIAIDCGALPENLVESELFGYERGAFTGADRRKLGHFELAQGGTIFLDEIGNLSVAVQAKLLRVLQERSIQRLGGRRSLPVDVRVLVASNVDLAGAVKQGAFREDLYHRLNEFTIQVPPLRARLADVPVLAEVFRLEANQELGKQVQGFAPEVFALLRTYPWPGNVREFKNTIKRSVLLAETMVLPEHLEVTLRVRQPLQAPASGGGAGSPAASPFPPMAAGPGETFPTSELKKAAKRAASDIEKQLIVDALQKTRFNKTEAARLLGIDRTALYYKMKKYGMGL